MRRRGVGIGAIKNKDAAQAKFKSKGSEMADDQLAHMSKQVEAFKENLEEFATKHKDDIRKNPQFRQQFQEMCSAIGVDPLASAKGFWALLGVGDYYYELGVQIIEVAMATSHRNGGIMEMGELQRRVIVSRGKNRGDVSIDDMLQAIKRLKVLGNGYSVIPVRGTYIVQAVPRELSMDHTAVLQQAEENGRVTCSQLQSGLSWDTRRVQVALDYMVKEGLAWVDGQDPDGLSYWFPGLFHVASQEAAATQT